MGSANPVAVLSDAVSSVGDAVGDIAQSAGDVIESAGEIVSDTIGSITKSIENTVDQALKNPEATLLKVAAIASGNPQFIPLINGADAIAKGASLEDAMVNAGASYVASEFAPVVGPDVADFTGSDWVGTVAQGATTGAVNAGLRGGDPLMGAAAGALNVGANTALDRGASAINYQLNQPSGGLPDVGMPSDITGGEFNLDQIKANADSVNKPFDYGPTGTQASGGLDRNATGAGLSMDSITGRSPSLTKMGSGQGITAPVEGGTLGAAGFTDVNAQPALGDPSSFINNPAVTGQPVVPSPTCAYDVNAPNLNFAGMLGIGQPTQGRRPTALRYGFNLDDPNIAWLDTRAQMLKAAEINPGVVPAVGAGEIAPAAPVGQIPDIKLPTATPQIAGITPEMASVLEERGINLASGGSVPHFASGSSTYCSTWGPLGEFAPKFYPVKCTMLIGSVGSKRTTPILAALKQMQPHIAPGGNMGGMAKGGLPTKYEEAAPKGHNPEFITGLTGYYAGGRGTGQSDDIPAMLHDGDYVIDAEAVSAFGDGSSKAGNEVLMHFMRQIPHEKSVGEGKPVPAKIADGEVVLPESFVTALGGGDNKRGAQMLDAMRQRLREHKRSAPNSKIPPKAKSPLDYLKGAKG